MSDAPRLEPADLDRLRDRLDGQRNADRPPSDRLDCFHGFLNCPGQDPDLLFDLPGFCLHRLREAGVGRAEWIGHCTYSDPDRFYSYRRKTHAAEPDYGRLVAAIAL